MIESSAAEVVEGHDLEVVSELGGDERWSWPTLELCPTVRLHGAPLVVGGCMFPGTTPDMTVGDAGSGETPGKCRRSEKGPKPASDEPRPSGRPKPLSC
jgi:hypothetical protein